MEIIERFTGRKMALVLGGSSGLGLATVHKLAQHGYSVLSWYRERRSRDETLRKEWEDRYPGQILSINADITKADVRNEVWKSCQLQQIQFTVLVHSIARGTPGALVSKAGQKPLGALDLTLTHDAMALSWLYVMQELAAHQQIAAPFSNLAFTSRGGRMYLPGYAAIGMAKSALETLGRYMAVEFASLGVRSNVLEIGITDTPALSVLPGSRDLISTVAEKHPLQRGTQPEDAANVVYLMCQPEARWINGAVIPVDGGESLI